MYSFESKCSKNSHWIVGCSPRDLYIMTLPLISFSIAEEKNLINLSKNGFLLRSWFVSSNLAWLGHIREVTPMQWQDITSLLGLYYDNIASVEKFPRQGYKIRWILVNKSVSKLKLSQKNGNNILFFFLNVYFQIKIISRKFLDIQNWLWKSDFGTFRQLGYSQNYFAKKYI